MTEFKGKNLDRSALPPMDVTVTEGVIAGLIILATAFTLVGLWGLERVIV